MNDIKQVTDRIEKSEKVEWKKLKPLQGANFKDLSKENFIKLKNSLMNNNFSMPFIVWQDRNDLYIIDGTHRQKALYDLESDGVIVPEKLQATFIKCSNRKEAAKLVLIYSSIYAKVQDEGMYEFLNIEGINFEDVKLEMDIPEIDLKKFDLNYFTDLDNEELDEVPEVQKEAVSRLGDLFLIDGKHRVLCGDSTKKEDVELLMNGNKADMVFTDPPYNVAFNGRSGKFEVIKNDDLSKEEFGKFIKKFLDILEGLKIKSSYICCNWAFYDILVERIKPQACIVWAKNVFGLGRGYRHQHEFILFNGYIKGDITNESDLWNIKKDTNYKHPTQKPAQLAIRAISNSSNDDDTILDFFLGSGSTLIASQQTNRICYGLELDPIYIDVILRRYKNLYPDCEIECINRNDFEFDKLWQK